MVEGLSCTMWRCLWFLVCREMVVPGMSTILKEVFLYMSSQDETIRCLLACCLESMG